MAKEMGATRQIENQADDPRIVRSRESVQLAVLQLLKSGRDFRSLTVSEVAKQAGVTRKTFYLRFGSLSQVVDALFVNTLQAISAHIDDEMLQLPLRDSSLSMLVFDAYEQHQETLAPLIRHCPPSLFMDPAGRFCGELLSRTIAINNLPTMPDVEREYLIAMVGGVTHSVLTVWVGRGFADPPEQLAEMVYALLGNGLQQMLLSRR
jgi:AcrR family transcriptional regulator